jgi:hypothetical protein
MTEELFGGVFADPENAEALREAMRRDGRQPPTWPGQVTYPSETPLFALANPLDGAWSPRGLGNDLPPVNSLIKMLDKLVGIFGLVMFCKDTTTPPSNTSATLLPLCQRFLEQAGELSYLLFLQHETQMLINNAGVRPDMGNMACHPDTMPRNEPFELHFLQVVGTQDAPRFDVPMTNRFFRLRRQSASTPSGWRVIINGDRNNEVVDIAIEFCTTVQSSELAAISYSWGANPRATRLAFESTTDTTASYGIQLGMEWNVPLFLDKLLELSRSKWLWLDQISLSQSSVTTKQLVKDIPQIYRYGEVHVLLPTMSCYVLDCLTFAATMVGAANDKWSSGIIALHQSVCKCGTTHLEWATRLWPWQELVLASRIRVHVGLGLPFESPYIKCGVMTLIRGLDGKMEALNQRPSTHRSPVYYLGTAAFAGWVLECPLVEGIPITGLSLVANDVLNSQRTCTHIRDVLPAIVGLVRTDEKDVLMDLCDGELNPLNVMEAVQALTTEAKLVGDGTAPRFEQHWLHPPAPWPLPSPTPYEQLIRLSSHYETGYQVATCSSGVGLFGNEATITPIGLTGSMNDVWQLVPHFSMTQSAHVDWVNGAYKLLAGTPVAVGVWSVARLVNLATMHHEPMRQRVIRTLQEAVEEASALRGSRTPVAIDVRSVCSALAIACGAPSQLVAVAVGTKWRAVLALDSDADLQRCSVFLSDKRIGIAEREDWLDRPSVRHVSSISYHEDNTRDFSAFALQMRPTQLIGTPKMTPANRALYWSSRR